MNAKFLLALSLLAAAPLAAADSSVSNQVQSALSKLAAAKNYSWTTTFAMPGSPFEPGPLKGSTEKGGCTTLNQDMGGNSTDAVMLGDKIVLNQDGQWMSPSELDGFPAMIARSWVRTGAAATEAQNLLTKTKDLKAGEGDVLASDLTEAGAKSLLMFGRREGEDGPPPPKNAKGSVKFWLKDGALQKFESHIQGLITFGPDQEERDFDMTRTTVIQDVGTAKLDVPAAAKAKLEGKPAEAAKP
ncbi:MAG: hypothetical protein U1F98_04360 [Verrucomicrobiota bacterium]